MTEPSHCDPQPGDAAKSGPSLESLQHKALELLKNPAVQAGGALVIGLLLARVAAGSKLRNNAVQILRGLLATKVISAFTTPPSPVTEPVSAPTPPAAPPPTPQPNQPFINLGRQILEAVAPQIGEVAKKKLAEVLRPRQ